MSTPQREMTFLLADPERRLLRSVAKRLPACVTSNYLTTVDLIGAVGAGGAYTLSGVDPRWLWAASLMLLVNWLGDSLDGTLARVRARERPRYGYYLDHLVDAFSTAIVGIGIGLSPYVQLEPHWYSCFPTWHSRSMSTSSRRCSEFFDSLTGASGRPRRALS